MKTFKKLFAYSAIFALLATMMPTYANAASYSDELTEAYGYAKNKWITTMASIDDADMYGNLTRVAMAKMVANYVLDLGLQELDTTKECKFPDVSVALDTAYDNGVTKACQLGLMGVGITKFNPNGIVTRAEFGTVLSRALWGDENNGGDPYYKKHLQALKDEGIMNMIDNPNMKEVRGYVMLMMMRADDNYAPAVGCSAEELLTCILADDYEACIAACSDEATEVLPGFVTVSKVGSTSNYNIARNAVAKKIGSIKLTAGENDTTVQSVVITRSGLGLVNDIEGLRLSRNGVDATDMRKPTTSNQTATLRFVPALVMKAGSSMEFDVLVSLSWAENSHHSFAVTAVNVNNGTSAGTPFDLSSVMTTSYTVGKTTATFGGSQTIKAWEKEKMITRVTIEPNKTATINGFTISKTAGEDFTKVLANVKAYYNSQEVGTVTVTTDKVVVAGLNIEKLNGENAAIELKADGIYVGSGNFVTYEIKDNDVVAIEKNTNERMRSDSAGTTPETLNIQGVDMVLTNKLTSSKTVAPGTSNVELYRAELTSNSEVEVTEYTLSFVTGSGDVDATFVEWEVTAYINGAEYSITSGGKLFDKTADRFIVAKNSPALIRVVGSVKTNALTGKNFKMNFKVNTVKNISDNVSFNPTGVEVESSTTTVSNGSFTLTRPSNVPSNKTVLEGSASDMMYFNLRASAEDQVLTKVIVTTNVFTGNNTTGFDVYASRLDLMQGTTVVKSVSTNLNSGAVVFDGFSRTLTKDTTTPFTVRVQLRGGEVQNLGLSVNHTVLTGGLAVARSANTSVPTTTTNPNLTSDTYQVASNIPVVTLPTKLNNETTLAIANTSNYDVVITSVKFDITRNIINNQFANWGPNAVGSLKEGNTVIGTGTAPGSITVATNILIGTDTVERIIELVDSQNTVTADLYSVKISELKFKYVDRNDNTKVSDEITETYNVLK